MASHAVILSFLALIFITAVCGLPLSEGEDLLRQRRSDKVIKADTEAETDSKASEGVASSSSSTKGSAVFISKDSHKIHKRSTPTSNRVIEAADTDAESDSWASEGVASSSSSTKGSAISTSKVSLLHYGDDEGSKVREDTAAEENPLHEGSEKTEENPTRAETNADRIKNLLHLG